MIVSLSDMVRSEDYIIYESESLDLQANIINRKPDPEIVTHNDIIDCMYEYVDLFVDQIRDKLNKQIEEVYRYHLDNESLDDIVYDYRSDS